MGGDVATMGDRGDTGGVVVAVEPRHTGQGRCTCGWVGKPRLLMSAARVDALIHAAQNDCEPAIPLVQPEAAITALKPPGILIVDCPADCGATLLVPLTITDTVEPGVDRDELRARFTAEAPELHDLVYRHLRNCAACGHGPTRQRRGTADRIP